MAEDGVTPSDFRARMKRVGRIRGFRVTDRELGEVVGLDTSTVNRGRSPVRTFVRPELVEALDAIEAAAHQGK